MGLLAILLAGALGLLALASFLVVTVWRLIAKQPSMAHAVANLVVAAGFALYLIRAVHWWATNDLLPGEWEHLAIPIAGLVLFGVIAALHRHGVRRDPLAL